MKESQLSKIKHPEVVVNRRVPFTQIGTFAKQAQLSLQELRRTVTEPQPRKQAPVFTASEVGDLCGIDRMRVNYLVGKDELPEGEIIGRGRQFTLSEARIWVQKASKGLSHSHLLTGGAGLGKILLSGNLKGGSTKSTTAMCVAQALSLRGRKVLVVDLDPQASLTELCGIYAERDVTVENTMQPYFAGDVDGVEHNIMTTYWDGIDCIAAHPLLFHSEFDLPARAIGDTDFQFWTLLSTALEPLRPKYDFIIIDTAPSLSLVTINALLAADSLIIPLVPEALDYISSMTYWTLFSDISKSFINRGLGEKSYDFISVVLSKVNSSITHNAVRGLAYNAYGDWVSPYEIPESKSVGQSGLGISTVFDVTKGQLPAKTVNRIKEPLTSYAHWIDDHYFVNKEVGL